MPIYEYSCSDCGLKFELLRQLSQANDKASCPRCRNNARRILSRFTSFSRGGNGETTPISNSCTSCSGTSCASCGH